ncbi:MerR family transcriptional regulator, partial [Staphylococcus aureus]|nr:MerR family transcriptional regulator [Staphylococcus aureus]
MAYTYTLKDIIEITGVTKRTLHYYDEIGLLVPDKNDKNYRVYKQQDLEKLQKILILKSFDFDIAKIKQYISYDNEQMRQLLSEQVSKLDKKISELQLIRRSVCEFIKGHSLIDTSILNKSLQTQYDKEASIKYGHTKAYQSFINRQDNLQSQDIRQKLTTIFNQFNQMS